VIMCLQQSELTAPQMKPIDRVDTGTLRTVLQTTILDHSRSSGEALLGRLENELHNTSDSGPLCEQYLDGSQ
jgi:hypothetical protein